MARNRSIVGRRGFLKTAAALAAASPAGMQNPVPNQDWVALTKEDALEPQLPIIDPHHHFWNTTDRNPPKYLLDDLAADVKGHNVRQTVFIECGSMYRAEGPEEFRVVGETVQSYSVATPSARVIACPVTPAVKLPLPSGSGVTGVSLSCRYV